jgi:hypothetical protein
LKGFHFEVIMDRTREAPCSDLAMLKHWVRLMRRSKSPSAAYRAPSD